MLRILSECAASVRNSLQGLDYFSADGSKAFEDLADVVKGMPAVGLEQDWKHDVQESLKRQNCTSRETILFPQNSLPYRECICKRTCTR